MTAPSDAVRAFAAWLAHEYPEIQREHMAEAADAYLASVAPADAPPPALGPDPSSRCPDCGRQLAAGHDVDCAAIGARIVRERFSKPDAPPPALGELARTVSAQPQDQPHEGSTMKSLAPLVFQPQAPVPSRDADVRIGRAAWQDPKRMTRGHSPNCAGRQAWDFPEACNCVRPFDCPDCGRQTFTRKHRCRALPALLTTEAPHV